MKLQWQRVLQLCGVNLLHIYSSMVREIYNQSNLLKESALISLRHTPISLLVDG
jgi:hypothetical protein